jgi:hypothetical protein
MPQNPIVEKLVKGAIERCRERITAARTGARASQNGREAGERGVTRSMKQSHGL